MLKYTFICALSIFFIFADFAIIVGEDFYYAHEPVQQFLDLLLI